MSRQTCAGPGRRDEHGRRTGCGNRTDAPVCRSCGRELQNTLDQTPALLDDLDITLTRQAVYGDRYGNRSTGKATPLVFDIRASQRLRDLENALAAAARAVAFTRFELGENRRRNVLDLAAHLAARLDQLRHVDQAGDLFARLLGAYDRVEHAIDRPADRWYAGPCWTPDCGRDLYADVGRPVAVCACGASYDVQTRRDYLLAEADDQLQNAATIARAVSWLGADPLTAERIRQWARRGRIAARAYVRCEAHRHEAIPPADCHACSPLYRVGDARDLLAADTNRRERTR